MRHLVEILFTFEYLVFWVEKAAIEPPWWGKDSCEESYIYENQSRVGIHETGGNETFSLFCNIYRFPKVCIGLQTQQYRFRSFEA